MIGYAGAVTTVLAAIAWTLTPRRRGLGLFTGLGAAFALLAFGFRPLVWLVGQVPGLATNPPNRTLVLVGLCIAVCGGLGTDALVRWAARTARPDLRAAGLLALLVLAIVGVVMALGSVTELRATAAERLDGEQYAAARRVAWAAIARTTLLLVTGAIAVAAALWARRRGGRAARAAPMVVGLALCALVGVDLVTFAHGWNTQVPRKTLFPDGPGISELAELSPEHRAAGADGVGHANVNLVYGIADLRARAFLTERQRGVLRGMDVAFFSPTRWDLRTETAQAWEPWLSASGVAAVLVPPGSTPPAGWRSEVLGPVELWRNPHAREVVTAVPRGALTVGGAAELVSDPEALHEVAYVEGTGSVELPAGRSADVLEWEAAGSRTTARVSSDGGAVLVVADAAVPGWRAWIDGEPAPVVTADHLFLGVVVPAGEHTVELRYRAPGALPGRALSALALVLLLAGSLVGRRRQQHPASA
jgi:hypothetical protein